MGKKEQACKGQNKELFRTCRDHNAVMVTRSRNRPYVRISARARVERRRRAHKWEIRGPLFRRASSLDDAVREIPDPRRRYIRFDRRSRSTDRIERALFYVRERERARAPSLKSRCRNATMRGVAQFILRTDEKFRYRAGMNVRK